MVDFQLLQKVFVRFDTVSLVLDKLQCFVKVPVLCFHDVSDDYRCRPADAHFAVHKDLGSFLPTVTEGEIMSFAILSYQK